MFNQLLRNATARPELIIITLMVLIIAMLIIPLPTGLVDFLIGLNIVIAILVFLGTFYIQRILDFSSFPALLLITTLFRLALSISTSRLILTQADAGEIIASFGEFVIGESLVVGFVVFSIVTVVQFIVITKGSERVAEVAARFSLDGMPGKQMSIDGDLKAGAIDAKQAGEKRLKLERESQLYGSFDGAMKFIKGDAIAGIIIIFVNFVGGMAIGVGQLGMDVSSAMATYTLLTIGDGLVAQIPALLIAIGAGFIVTRVESDESNLGRSMVAQILSNPFVLGVTCLLALGVGMLPGFPLLVFILIAASLIAVLWFRHRKALTGAGSTGGASEPGESTGPHEADDGLLADVENLATETVPLMLLMRPENLAELQRAKVSERLRNGFFLDYGVKMPELHLRGSEALPEGQVAVLINEVRAEQFDIFFDRLRVVSMAPGVEQMDFDLRQGLDANRQVGYWCRLEDKQTLTGMGCQLRPAYDELYRCLVLLLARNVQEYFGVQETKTLLDELDSRYPDLLKEVYRHATVQKIAEILQRLLSERISVRNMKLILEALAQWGSREKDTLALCEHVRAALARYITNKFANGDELRVLMLSPGFENVLRAGIRQTNAGSFLNVEPDQAEQLLDQLGVALDQLNIAQKDVVLLGSVDIRRYVKKFVESRFRELDVMSFGEVSETVSINVLKTV